MSCCVLVHQWLPGAVLHIIFSEMCLLLSVIKIVICFNFFFFFLLSLSTLCVSPAVYPFFLPLLSALHDDGCSFTNHELYPVPHPLGDPLSTPSALFPVVITYFLLPLSLSILFPLFVPPSPSPLTSI